MCDRCPELEQQLEQFGHRFRALTIDLENTQADVLAKNRLIGQLKADLKKLEAADPVNKNLQQEAQTVYEYWKARCRPKAKAFDDKRRTAVLARFRDGYTLEDLLRAVDGAKVDPFIAPGGRVFNELSLICRDNDKTDSFIERALLHETQQEEWLASQADPVGMEIVSRLLVHLSGTDDQSEQDTSSEGGEPAGQLVQMPLALNVTVDGKQAA